jgi:formylglycine-generating enzyme required for sulfatase activity
MKNKSLFLCLFLVLINQFIAFAKAISTPNYFGETPHAYRLTGQYKSDNFGKWKLKNLENSFKKVSNRIFMAETEVTNQQYNYYLSALLEQKDFATLMVVKSEKVDWRGLLPEKLKNLADKALYPYGQPDEATFPAQNMSHEAAVGYCNWLTNFYNNEDPEKRKWKKVIFRLPTEEEWTTAARAGMEKAFKYPWKFNTPQNPKGCFLSNFNCTNEDCKDCKYSDQITKDGALFTAKADSYFPNDFGLYGMIGNVAEMTATKGLAKGGSWEDIPSECTLQSQKKYTNPSPAIGFRILMEIVE